MVANLRLLKMKMKIFMIPMSLDEVEYILTRYKSKETENVDKKIEERKRNKQISHYIKVVQRSRY